MILKLQFVNIISVNTTEIWHNYKNRRFVSLIHEMIFNYMSIYNISYTYFLYIYIIIIFYI